MATVSTLVVALTAQTTDFERGLKRAEKSLDRTSSKVSSLGGAMSAGLTAPIVGLGVAAAKMALDFADPFDKMNSILGQSAAQTNVLKQSVLQLAGQTAQSPQELAAALLRVESSGIRGKAAMDVLTASAEASTAGLGSVGTIARSVTAVMNAYGPGVISAAQATSVLIAATAHSRATGEELATSMTSILPIAAQAGVSFDQLAAAVSVMTQSGMEASQATMALRTVLGAILKPSTAAQQALAEVGLSTDELQAQLKSQGLPAALKTLSTAFAGNAEAMNKVFPNARTFSGVLSLMGTGAKGSSAAFNDMAKVTTDVLGKAFATAATQDGFKFKQAMTEIQVLLIKIGDSVLPAVVPLVQAFTARTEELIKAFDALSPQTKDLIIVVSALAAAIGPALLAIASLYSAASTLLGGLGLLVSFGTSAFTMLYTSLATVGELGVAIFGALSSGAGMAGAALTALASTAAEIGGAVVALAATVTGPALLAFGLMAAAAVLIVSRWTELKTDFGTIMDWLAEEVKATFVGKIIAYIGQFASYAADVLSKFGVDIKSSASTAFAATESVVGGAVDGIKAHVSEGLGAAVSEAKQLGGQLVQSLKNAASGALGEAKQMSAQLMGTVKSAGAIGGPGMPAFGSGGSGLPVPSSKEISAWQNFGTTTKDVFSSVGQGLQALKATTITTADQMQAQINGMAKKTASSMGAMTEAFLTGKVNLGQFVKEMIVAIGELIAKILILKALTAAGLGGDFATGFVGAMSFHADGGRPAVGQMSVVGEKGPELFVPDTAGTIIPNSALGGGGAQVTVNSTVQITGMDLGSEEAARRLATTLKEVMRSGASEGISLALQSAQVAQKNTGRSV